jgi:hypothetical protein
MKSRHGGGCMENKGHHLFIDVHGDKTMGCTTALVRGSLRGERSMAGTIPRLRG